MAISDRPRRPKIGGSATYKVQRRRRNFSVGGKEYGFKRSEGDSKTVTRPEAGKRVATFKDKQSGGTLTRSFTKSADAKNTRIGRYARQHKTTNADGSITYQKKGGGTVTETRSVSTDMPEGRKGKKRRRSSSPSGSSPGSSTPSGD